MFDVAAVVIAIISLIASVVTTGITAWSTYNLDKRKSIREAAKLLRKYQAPLVLAARDLQARLYNIVSEGILFFADGSQEQYDTLFIYTAYLVGQYFAWIHILRRQGQFIAFTSGGKQRSRSQEFIKITDQITDLLNTDVLEPDFEGGGQERWDSERRSAERWDAEQFESEGSFVLWKDHQRAMGEVMTKRDESSEELLCMEFSEFTTQWKDEDHILRNWFRAVPNAIRTLVAAGRYAREAENMTWNTSEAQNPSEGENGPALGDTIEASRRARHALKAYEFKIRLVLLQRLLVDLVIQLDEERPLGAGESWKLKEESIPNPSYQ